MSAAQLSRRRVLGGAAASVGAAAMGALSGCTPPPKRVFVIGDSITNYAVYQGLGRPTNGGATTWTIDAANGLGTTAAAELVGVRDLRRIDLVIVALGTNDYLDTAATYGVRIDQMMAAVDGHPRVRWMNVDAHTRKLRPAAAGVNVALAAAPARHPNLGIVDWHAIIGARADAPALRDPDMVHYVAAGSVLRRDATEAVAR